MNHIIFARVLAISTLYLELVDESALDLDTAVQGMEEIAAVLQDLDPQQIAALDDALQQVATEYDGEARETVQNMARDYGLVDDPDEDGEGGD